LNVEEEAVRKPEECGQLSASGNPKVNHPRIDSVVQGVFMPNSVYVYFKVFVPRDALMSRANSLKKALRQIIDHTEQG
jgi:diacylglycerol kinase (ATP)